jgi:hypothetical protein
MGQITRAAVCAALSEWHAGHNSTADPDVVCVAHDEGQHCCVDRESFVEFLCERLGARSDADGPQGP